MKVTVITSFLASFIAAAAAQTTTPFYLTSPIVGTTYTAGSNVTITWSNGVDESAQVGLLTGTNAATMTPTGDSFTIKGSDGEYKWEVPSDLPQNATFSFKIDYTYANGTSGATYSSAFTVTNTTGDVVSQSFVSSNAAAISTAASSSSVSESSAIPSSSSSSSSSVLAGTRAASTTTASASTTPQAPSAANGFKAPTIAICAITMIASALSFF